MAGQFEGKVALVTGAARGQGCEIARQFTLSGAMVAISDVGRPSDEVDYPLARESELAETAAKIEGLGGTVFWKHCDVRACDEVDAFVRV